MGFRHCKHSADHGRIRERTPGSCLNRRGKRSPSAYSLDVERPFHPCSISTKETNDRGDNSHEGNRGDGPGCGNGRDEAGGAARAAGSDNDVVVQVHASGFTWDELTWPSTWTDRLGRDRTPVIPGQEL